MSQQQRFLWLATEISAAGRHRLFKLTASDAAAEDWLGYSVAISGDTALVGAPRNDDAGSLSGCAYLFDTTTGNQYFELTAADAAPTDLFGESVSISGNIAIVGARLDDDAGSGSGSAYLFDTAGNQLFKLTASDAAGGDDFGRSVATNGNIALVGAPSDDDGGSSSGSVYLFDVSTGNQLFKLTATDAAVGDVFGRSVAISGNIALVGAEGNDDSGSSSGSAYIFDVTTGNQLLKLAATDADVADVFGMSVAVRGNTALVGAPWDDDGGNSSGSAYLFNATTGSQLFKLTASDAAADDNFGRSVAIDGNTAIVGAFADDDGGLDSGSAYLFDIATGSQLAKLTASDAAAVDYFGRAVAIRGNAALVGAYLDDDDGNSSGSAYLFEAPAPITGDANEDGIVNILDLSALSDNWQSTGVGFAGGDFNGDGIVNIVDLSDLSDNWGYGEASSPITLGAGAGQARALGVIPEPGTLALLVGPVVVMLGRRGHGNCKHMIAGG